MNAQNSVVVPFPGAEQPAVPEMMRRLVAMEAVHSALLALAQLDREAPVRLALSQARSDVTLLMLEAMPDDITPDEVMDYAAAQADAVKLEMVYEIYRDRLWRLDDHMEALFERSDGVGLVTLFLPRFLPRLKRLQDVLQKLMDRDEVALFGQVARECDVARLDDATLLAEEADERVNLARRSKNAGAEARAQAFKSLADELLDRAR